MIPEGKSLVIFDGFCVLCSRTVRFVLRADRKHKLLFIADPGLPAQLPLKALHVDHLRGESIIFIRDGKVYSSSRAAIEILVTLGGGWKIFALLRAVPRKWGDYLYSLIARNRYRWFGKRNTCYLPDPEHKHRILTAK